MLIMNNMDTDVATVQCGNNDNIIVCNILYIQNT